MAKDRPPTYTPAPEPPTDPDLRRRYDAIMSVLAQTQTVSGAADSIGMSRNHFQTILHRVIAAIIDALTPKAAGRPAKPQKEAALEAENARLRSELARMTERAAMIERLMGVVSSISSGQMPLPRSRKRSKTKKQNDDPEPAFPLQPMVTAMSDLQVPTALWAKVLGISETTVRRRLKPALASVERSESTPQERAYQRVRNMVRATHGLVGAASLGRTCGVSRRQAAAIKKRELREMEIERKQACRTVSVLAPGLVRGFDAMHVPCVDGKAYWLVAADAAVPYRTSVVTAPTYDAEHVIAALAADFEENGAPLVLRLDRIACHRTPEVEQLLREYQVLALHGPPQHPCFYGQLERQNREHRAWQRMLRPVTQAELATVAGSMRTALNALWARPTLGWCTAQEAWERRPKLDVDRRQLLRDVEWQAAGLVNAGFELLHARRLAIETALIDRGLLTITQGGWC